MRFAAFYYPGFSACCWRNAASGTDVNEWSLLYSHPPSVFFSQPALLPKYGAYDSAVPAVMSEELRLASFYGIDALIFNYYYDGVNAELLHPLQAYLSSKHTKVQFGLNICCRMPRRRLPFGVHEFGTEPPIVLNVDQFETIAAHLVRHYIVDDRCLEVEGKQVVCFYDVGTMLRIYGLAGCSTRIDIFRNLAAKANKTLHVIGLFAIVGAWSICGALDLLPFDGYSCYVALPDFRSKEPVQEYGQLVDRWIIEWRSGIARSKKPLYPCASSGWDATPRGEPGYDPHRYGLRFPYYPVVRGATPEAFGTYLHHLVSLQLLDARPHSDLMFLGPWNEWTEGCVLLPDAQNGTSRLEEVLRVKKITRRFH